MTMMTTGTVFAAMWARSCELWPELKVVDDDSTKHKILQCATKEAQDAVLKTFLETRGLRLTCPRKT